MLKHIVFDFDGTIADASHLILDIFNDLSEKYHYKKSTMDEFLVLNNYSIKERFRRVGISLYKLPQFSIDCMFKYRQLLDSLKLYEGMRALLTDLKNDGLSLSIISSNSVENINDFLQKNELTVFDHIISAKNLFGKHHTIKKYLKEFHLKADEILYIGDEIRDIEACKKMSVKIISVVWGYDSLALLQSGNPDYIAKLPNDIFEIVKSKIL